MSSLLGTNLEQEKKAEEKRGGEMLSTRHEPVYHAAHGCQAASLSLTASRLRGLFWAWPVESQKTAGVLALLEQDQLEARLLGSSWRVLLLRLGKNGGFITAVTEPERKDDPDPDIGECAHGLRVTFPFFALAPIVVLCPRFLLGAL